MGKMSDVSDGYHTFGELYEHRAALSAALFCTYSNLSWKSKKHHDGTMIDDESFIVGMQTPFGRISYHYNLRLWDWFPVQEYPFAPEYDGHTSQDTIERLNKWVAQAVQSSKNSQG